MSISDKLQTLINGKTELVNAINDKAGTALTVSSPWSDLKDSVNGLGSGGENSLKKFLDATHRAYYLFATYSGTSVDHLIKKDDTTNVTDMSYMFYSCNNLTTIPLLDTSQVTDMSYMFSGCSNLTTIPLLDTSQVTDMRSMFSSCSNLTTIPLLDTTNVTIMLTMFGYCSNLNTIPLLDTTNVTNMRSMFISCFELRTIPLLDISKVTDMTLIFASCGRLTKIIIYNSTTVPPLSTDSFSNCHHFNGTFHKTYNRAELKDGRIYVPDDMVEAFRIATNWSVYADQILPLSELPTEE